VQQLTEERAVLLTKLAFYQVNEFEYLEGKWGENITRAELVVK
jgi:hypothetical protein